MKTNKVLWIIDHYASEPKYGGYTRQYSLAREIAQTGIDVVVLASSFSHFTHKYMTEDEITVSEISPNAHFIYIKTNSYDRNSGIQRLFGMRSFTRKVIKHSNYIEMKFGRPDWIVASSPHIYAWIAGERIAKKYNASYNIEIRDFWPWELRTGNEDLLHKLLFAFFDHIETRAFTHADKIICTTQDGADYCDDMKKPGKEKFVYIGQPLDCERYDDEADKNFTNIPKEIREFIGNDFYCVFSGYYMPYEGVLLMLAAAEKTPEVKFVFVGSGKEEENMRKWVQDKKMRNVIIWNRIQKECIPGLLKHSGACLAYLFDESKPDMFKYGMSKNKVNEYLYSGAVTIMGFDMTKNEVLESGGGYTFNPRENHFAEYIQKVAKMSPVERKAMGDKAREYMKQVHGTKQLAQKYVNSVLV